MKTWLVTRHKGAEEWADMAGVRPDAGCVVASLKVQQVEAGDLVVGTLPTNLAADIIAKGARYLHLSLNVPEEARGQELGPDDMRKYGAHLEEYEVRKILDYPGATAPAGLAERPVVMICIASEQTLPNLLPLLKWLSDRKPIAALHVVRSDSPRINRAVQNLQSVSNRLKVKFITHPNMPEGPPLAILDFASRTLKKIRGQHPDALFVLNTTGGTKPMSMAMLHALGPNGEALYCDTERERIEFIQPISQPAIPLPPLGLDVDTILMAHGIEASRSLSTKEGWLETARQREPATAYLRRLSAADKSEHFFGTLQSILWCALPQKGPFKARVGKSKVKGNPPKNFAQLCAELKHEDEPLIRITDTDYEFPGEDAARYLQGGWLEEMLALAVDSICRQHEIPECHWRVGMDVINRNANRDKPLNEIDMAIAYRNRLLVIECKSGAGVAKDDQNILNKLEAVGSYVGGRLAAKWLLASRVIPDNVQLLERRKNLHIELLTHDCLKPGVLEQRIENWLGFPPETGAAASTAPPVTDAQAQAS